MEWHLLKYAEHEGLRRWVADLNRLYRSEPALYQVDFDQSGFEWVDCNDSDQSVLSFLRRPRGGEPVLVVCNFTPVPRANYIVGVPRAGYWREIANSDASLYGGSGMGNLGGSIAAAIFISLLEAYASLVVSPSQAAIVSFVVLILTLLFRPTGLFVATPK